MNRAELIEAGAQAVCDWDPDYDSTDEDTRAAVGVVIDAVAPRIAWTAARFMVNVQPIEIGCWMWTGGIVHGYGCWEVDGRRERAHRWAWELFVGPIPEGMHVLHRCDNPPCVNPNHLFLGTQTDNVQDMDAKGRRRNQYADRTACHNGHPYVEGSWRWSKNGRGGIGRVCRECHRLAQQRRREASRG